MAQVIIGTPRKQIQGAVAVTSATSFTDAAVSIGAKPSGGLLWDVDSLDSGGIQYPNLVKITPGMQTAGLTSMGMRVYGWNFDQFNSAWMPTLLGDFNLGWTSGTPQNDLIYYFPCSITSNGGVATVNLYSPATIAAARTEPCSVVIDVIGSQIVQVLLKASAGGGCVAKFYTI